MIAILTAARKRSRFCPIRLNRDFAADLAWWDVFLCQWNGISLMRLLAREPTQVTLSTDASGNWGCGGYIQPDYKWFSWRWDNRIQADSIAIKELFPIVVAAAIYGKIWAGKGILRRCDNQAVVATLNSRYAKDNRLMHLLRTLFFFEAQYNFRMSAQHIPGIHITWADDISRNKHTKFLHACPNMPSVPTNIPESLISLLFLQVDWTSQLWQERFSSFIA